MSEFKQIIGRGTRLRDDYGKLWFNILDYTGSATRMFADPDFDGDPARITEEEVERRRRNDRDDRDRRPKGRSAEPAPPEEGEPGDYRTAGRRAAQILLRRRSGRNRRPPRP